MMSQSLIQPDDKQPGPVKLLWALGLICVLMLAMLSYRGLYRGLTSSSDLGLYYCSTLALMQTGDPYSPEGLRELAEQTGAPTQFIENAIAPPICYTPLLPYAVLPWPVAHVLWACTNLLGVAMLWYWLLGLARIPRKRLSPELLAVTIFVVGFAPLQTNIAFGQMAVLASAFIVGAIAMAQQGKIKTAACLYVLSGLLKPQLAAPFLLYWLYQREWRVLAYTAGFGLAITLLTLTWLQFKNPQWLDAYRENLYRLTRTGGASDYTRDGAFIFSDLRVPLYSIFQSKSLTSATAWATTVALAGLAYLRLRRDRANPNQGRLGRPLHDLHAAGFVACLGLLPIYHVYYDTTILLIPAAWAVASFVSTRNRPAIAALILLTPMLVPGQPLLNYLERRGALPAILTESPAYQWFILPHLPWLTIAIALCMIMHRIPRQPPINTRLELDDHDRNERAIS